MNAQGPGPPAPPQPDGACAIIGDVQVLAQQVHDLQTCLAVLVQEAQQIFAPDCSHLSIIEQPRCHFMRTAREDGTESQNFSGPRDTKG